MISDLTLGLIYTCKQVGQTDTDFSNFLQQYHSSSYPYSREEIDTFLRKAIVDYLATADDTQKEIRRYFLDFWTINPIDEHKRMVSFLAFIQVMYDEEYINGVRENPFADWEMFKDE